MTEAMIQDFGHPLCVVIPVLTLILVFILWILIEIKELIKRWDS